MSKDDSTGTWLAAMNLGKQATGEGGGRLSKASPRLADCSPRNQQGDKTKWLLVRNE
jgi:hypothetical protein